MYTIYSVGDVQYLARVFDGVSMLTGSGSLVGASAIACLIGVIFLCFQSVINTQGIKIQNVLVCFVIYLVCFAVPTQVNIVSSNDDSNFAQRDNVPLGIAMIGSTISTITHELTEKMEIAMTPVLTDSTVIASKNGGGYANSLYLLNHVTRPQTGYAVQLVDSKNPGFINNLNSYAAECTVIKYILGGKNTPKDFSQLATKNFIDAVTFDSEVYFTSLTDPQTGSIEDYSCREGMAKIKSWWNDSLKNLTEAESASLAKELLGASSNSGNFTSYNEIVNRISAKTAEMAGMGYATADRGLPQLSTAMVQELIFANATRDVVMRGVAQGYTSFSDTNSSYMLTQAMLQRNSQWAAESSMFLNSVPAIMAFIEGFFYAITPFASILILLGLFGLNIFIKYIILLLWVQLWTPVMAIINMYIMHGAALDIFKIPAQLTGQDSSVSLYMNDSIAQVTENWISVGSMFMAATPLLTFIILTGSAYALTSLTSRMNGADVINERMITPDLIQPGAGLAMSSVYNGNMASTLRSGMEKLLQNFNLASSVSAATSYALSHANTKANEFTTSFTKALSEADSYTTQRAMKVIDSDIKNSTNQQLTSLRDQLAHNITESLIDAGQFSRTDRDSVYKAVQGSLSFDVSKMGFKIGAGAEAGWKSEFSDSFAKTLTANKGKMDELSNSFSTDHSVGLALGVSDSLTHDGGFSIMNKIDGNTGLSYSDAGKNVRQELVQAQEMQQAQNALQTENKFNAVDLVSYMSNSEEGRRNLQAIDQKFNEMYQSADASQQAVIKSKVDQAMEMHLTGDSYKDEMVGKLYALVNTDIGNNGFADDLQRQAETLNLATSTLPGGSGNVINSVSKTNAGLVGSSAVEVGTVGANSGTKARVDAGREILSENSETNLQDYNSSGGVAAASAKHRDDGFKVDLKKPNITVSNPPSLPGGSGSFSTAGGSTSTVTTPTATATTATTATADTDSSSTAGGSKSKQSLGSNAVVFKAVEKDHEDNTKKQYKKNLLKEQADFTKESVFYNPNPTQEFDSSSLLNHGTESTKNSANNMYALQGEKLPTSDNGCSFVTLDGEISHLNPSFRESQEIATITQKGVELIKLTDNLIKDNQDSLNHVVLDQDTANIINGNGGSIFTGKTEAENYDIRTNVYGRLQDAEQKLQDIRECYRRGRAIEGDFPTQETVVAARDQTIALLKKSFEGTSLGPIVARIMSREFDMQIALVDKVDSLGNASHMRDRFIVNNAFEESLEKNFDHNSEAQRALNGLLAETHNNFNYVSDKYKKLNVELKEDIKSIEQCLQKEFDIPEGTNIKGMATAIAVSAMQQACQAVQKNNVKNSNTLSLNTDRILSPLKGLERHKK